MHELSLQIKQQAKRIGFDLVGIAPAEPSRYQAYLRQWLDDGRGGNMEYLRRRFEERIDPARYVPDAKSVICLAINYCQKLEGSRSAASGRVARYALGDDYHDFLKSRLHKLADWIHSVVPGSQTRCAVDTAPVMEKELAARAGVGWLGKNTCIINQQIGSWVLLGEVITTLELPPDEPAIDRCGTCRRCIDACPTQAITAPYQLDARKCISYLTIELRDEIPAEYRGNLNDWIFGCDICQEVCPWNSEAPIASDPNVQTRFPDGTINLQELLNWRQEDYSRTFRGSPIKRVKLPILQNNARAILENAKQ
ncbi:MAG TPA: tRNA epoxyqueuosine(34) reductase QueG [Tepidisphaeraceae bacterium]|nr:tRNA epoxyqueuosine(34) reductase QueG [Tepidisphaeraceae bacterium]